MALLADSTTHSNKSRRADIDGIGAQGNRLGNVAAAPNTAGNDDRCPIAYTLLPQATIYRRQRHFYGNADIITDNLWRGAGSSSKAVKDDYIGSGTHHTAGDSRRVMYCGYLYRYRF